MNYQKILLIDDDQDDQEIFLTALGKVSHLVSCTAVSSAIKALHLLSSGQLSADVIFLDLNMPVMNGQQFLVQIKKEEALKNIPVIVFSTSSHLPTIRLTKELGAEGFITKPGSLNELCAILRLYVAMPLIHQ